MSLKNLGNEHFRAGEFKEADQLYSLAYAIHPIVSRRDPFSNSTCSIQKNPSEPKLFSNRALTRVKLQDWSGAETDARKAIELYGPKNPLAMKAYYTLGEALLGLNHPKEALETAKHAYKICLEIRDSSSSVLSQFILRTKQAQWQSKETARLRELNATLANVEDLLQQQLDGELARLNERFARQEIGEVGRSEEQAALEKEAQERQTMVRDAFKNAQAEETAERVSATSPFSPASLVPPPTNVLE
jgi:STIP1 homology and U-box containing protein 1